MLVDCQPKLGCIHIAVRAAETDILEVGGSGIGRNGIISSKVSVRNAIENTATTIKTSRDGVGRVGSGMTPRPNSDPVVGDRVGNRHLAGTAAALCTAATATSTARMASGTGHSTAAVWTALTFRRRQYLHLLLLLKLFVALFFRVNDDRVVGIIRAQLDWLLGGGSGSGRRAASCRCLVACLLAFLTSSDVMLLPVVGSRPRAAKGL